MRLQIFRKSIYEPDYDVIDTKNFTINTKEQLLEIIWLNSKNQYQQNIYNKEEIEDIMLYSWQEVENEETN